MSPSSTTTITVLISVILATSAFLAVASSQQTSVVTISEEQAISTLKENARSKTDPRIIYGFPSGSASPANVNLEYISLNWTNYLKTVNTDSNAHNRIYVSPTPVGEVRPYWLINYETSFSLDYGGSGRYVIDAQTGELMLSLESTGGGITAMGPDYLITFQPEAWDSNNPVNVKLHASTPITLTLSAEPYYNASLSVSIKVSNVPLYYSVDLSRATAILNTGGSVTFTLSVIWDPVADFITPPAEPHPHFNVEVSFLGRTDSYPVYIVPPPTQPQQTTDDTQRSATIIIGEAYSDVYTQNDTFHIIRSWVGGTLSNDTYVISNETTFESLYIGSKYNVTYIPAILPGLGICRAVKDIRRIPEKNGTLGTNPYHVPFLSPSPPDYPIDETYGIKTSLNDAAGGWQRDQGETLLQPTWLPVGLNETAVYVQRAAYSTNNTYPSLKKGEVTQVTTLYSYNGLDNPWSAELQLRVQMAWVTPWMTPGNLREYAKLGGNYTEVNGYKAWVGEIGWFEGDYFERYGGSAMVLSMEVGSVLYFFRVPEGFSHVDLIKIAESLK